jgi:glyoxylase-like metal-dependent hydrolase (beta-lactamase superfamily II)
MEFSSSAARRALLPRRKILRFAFSFPLVRPIHLRAVARTIPLDAGIVAIDTGLVGFDEMIAAYVVPGEQPAIVETGPATVARAVVEGVESLGIGLGDIATLVVSHIHLDHAGASGDLIDVFPNATVVVHEQGARHLVDPTKLMASAYRVFGDRLDELFGPQRPVPAERLRAVDEGDRVEIGGGRMLDVMYAPGHARHHMAVQDSASGALFVGDAMGVYLPEAGVLRPATPPPDFDLELALTTLRRFRERNPSAIYLTHFGPAPADRDLLAEAEERLVRYGEIVREAMRESEDLDFITERLQEKTRDDYKAVSDNPELQERFEVLNAFRSAAAGYVRYFQQKR